MKISNILEKLIEFKTVHLNYVEFDKCFNFIKEYYSDSSMFIKEFCFNSDRSILISNSEDINLDVLFVGHVDVVPATDDDFKPKIVENRMYGRGSFDMKGHVAVMMKLLRENKFKNKIGLLLTSDEERGGFNGTGKILNELNYSCKVALVPDAGNNFEVIDEEKGVLQLKVSYKGIESHSSQVWNGDNAIKRIIDLYNFLLSKFPLPTSSKDYKTSINISKIEGGNSTNKVAGECAAVFDIRHIASDQKQYFLKLINEYNSKFEVEILAQGEPFLTIKKNKFYKKFEECYLKVLGKNVQYSKCESASDGRFFYSKGIPCILMNACGNNLHAKDEYIEIDSLDVLYNIYLDYLKELEKII